MKSPIEQWRKEVEEALDVAAKADRYVAQRSARRLKALQAIATATAELLREVSPSAFTDPKGGEIELRMWAQHWVKELRQVADTLTRGENQ